MGALGLTAPVYCPEAPVPIFQHELEFMELLVFYRGLKPKATLEVGSYFGGTLYHFLRNSPKGATVVSVDNHVGGIDNRHLYPEWAPSGVTVYAIEGDSGSEETVARVQEWGPFDFLFIDADHSYAAVERDWELYRPMVKPGGMVALHDILPPTRAHPEIEVSRLWAEIQSGYTTDEIIEDPGADWGGIGVVWL